VPPAKATQFLEEETKEIRNLKYNLVQNLNHMKLACKDTYKGEVLDSL